MLTLRIEVGRGLALVLEGCSGMIERRLVQCSHLRATDEFTIPESKGRDVDCIPFPDCAKATNANATKNSSLDTRGLELTKLTIYNAPRRNPGN